jgi:hypothetical protein
MYDQFEVLYEGGAKTAALVVFVPGRPPAPQQVFRRCARVRHFAVRGVDHHRRRDRRLAQEELSEKLTTHGMTTRGKPAR